MARWWRSRSGGRRLGDPGLVEDLLEGHAGEQRDEARNERGVLGGLDDEGELHGGLGHFDGGLGALVEGAVDDVGPADELGDGSGVEAERVDAMWARKLVQEM